MKIPKRILKVLELRQKYAEKLNCMETELDNWLEKKGIDLGNPEIADALISGCLIYCEPGVAHKVVKEYVEKL